MSNQTETFRAEARSSTGSSLRVACSRPCSAVSIVNEGASAVTFTDTLAFGNRPRSSASSRSSTGQESEASASAATRACEARGVTVGLGLAVGVLAEDVDRGSGVPPPERAARVGGLGRVGADDELLGHPVDGPPALPPRTDGSLPGTHSAIPRPAPNQARDVGALELVTQVRLDVGVVVSAGKASTNLKSRARNSGSYIDAARSRSAHHVRWKTRARLPASEIGDPPGELLDGTLVCDRASDHAPDGTAAPVPCPSGLSGSRPPHEPGLVGGRVLGPAEEPGSQQRPATPIVITARSTTPDTDGDRP